jgi:cellulose synthase/poly-beta-1,6-N-acetylglucosamine synthase-like glycosyltransferase
MADHYGREFVRLVVIDDSDDETREAIDGLASRYRSEGYLVDILRRGSRAGFKAGALQAALQKTTEEYVAVFDADFSPPLDFLNRTVPFMLDDGTTGFVQCRWSHFDRNYNMITETLAIGIDAHFLLEQPGRWSSGYMMNFNGSAGLLRTEAIVKAGGWQSNTLAEDLDVSYRMQLAGYHAIYLKDLEVPAELPPTITSLKRQQGRWARGSMQTAKKVMPTIFRSRMLSVNQKLEAFVHLTYYLVHPLMVASFLLAIIATFLNIDVINYAVDISIPTLQIGRLASTADLTSGLIFFTFQIAPWVNFTTLVVLSTLAVLYYCMEAVRVQKLGLLQNLKQIFLLVILGYGISISNSVSALSGLLSPQTGTFLRTPKYAITAKDQTWKGKKYQLSLNRVTLLECLAVVVGSLAVARAFQTNNVGIIPILAIYLAGYLLVFVLTVSHSSLLSRRNRRRAA